jgi:ubiquinone/menaquinone biosynthesis C-methylase UbiE
MASRQLSDSEIVVGNVYDKYRTGNPFARYLMRGFLRSLAGLYGDCRPRSVLEVGCGEGRLAQYLCGIAPKPDRFEITDVDISRVDAGLDPEISVRQASIYELPYAPETFDLVVCCEVLEHLDEPDRGLAEVTRVARRHVLLSTPWEPVWRALNIARGRYVRALGNTPGHVQHFSRRGLERLASRHLKLLRRRTPLPWTILLGEKVR